MTFPKKPTKKRNVYLDYAAATPMHPRVVRAMQPYMARFFANPSALYGSAVQVRQAIEENRKKVADFLHTQADTIFFTSGGTESINMAILGVAKNQKIKGTKKHIVTTAIEHAAVLETVRALEKEGWDVTYLPVHNEGIVSAEQVRQALRKETVLVSVMMANNEIGSIQPIADIGREILKWRKIKQTPYPFFHTDACQAAAYGDLTVERLHVDLLSLNGGKICGPKGVGVLYKRRGTPLQPIVFGGGQEMRMRSGTENVAGVIGFATALAIVEKDKTVETKRMKHLRDYFWKRICARIPDVRLNGPEKEADRLPNNLHVTFSGASAEALILYLDTYGVQCATGSACAADSDDVSHVLTACGVSREDAKSSIRFTLGRETTKSDIDYAMKYLPSVVQAVRIMEKKTAAL